MNKPVILVTGDLEILADTEVVEHVTCVRQLGQHHRGMYTWHVLVNVSLTDRARLLAVYIFFKY